jgi:hypothetical protein
MPVVAYKDKGLVFTKFHDQLLPPDIRVEEVLFECTCGDICREIVIGEIANGNPESVSILKKGGTFFVLATVAQVLQLRNGATFMTKMTEQQILSPRTEKRLQQYVRFAVQEYVQAVADQAQIEGRNCQRWCARQPSLRRSGFGSSDPTKHGRLGRNGWMRPCRCSVLEGRAAGALAREYHRAPRRLCLLGGVARRRAAGARDARGARGPALTPDVIGSGGLAPDSA